MLDGRELRDFFAQPQVVTDLKTYYAVGDRPATFTGRHFDTLAAERQFADRNIVTADDLLAVKSLSMRLSQTQINTLLSGSTADQLSQALQQIPVDVHLADAPSDLIADGSAADRFWRTVRSVPGLGPVTAGKLLARKRPLLIPVYDSVVKQRLGWPSLWVPLHAELSQGLHDVLLRVRAEAEIGAHISPLRVFDVALWMDGRTGSAVEKEDAEEAE